MTAAIWLLLLVPLLLGLAAQGLVRSTFRRYGAIANHARVTGAEAGRALLDAHGLQRVVIEIIPGFLTDHYDGEAKALRLSEAVGSERSVAALGIAGHEVSHAFQDAEGSRTYRARRSIGDKLAQFAPWSTFFLIAGFWFGVEPFIVLSLLFVGGLVLFALAALPVEVGASHRVYTRDPRAGGIWSGPDVERARSLVERSGTAGRQVTVQVPSDKLRVGRYLARLLESLGYRSRVRAFGSYGAFHDYVADSRNGAQVGTDGWAADFPTPADFTTPFSCTSHLPRSPENANLSQYRDQGFERRIEAALRANYQHHPLFGVLLDQAWVRTDQG